MPMSATVRAKEPVIRQVFVGHSANIVVTDALERKLYIIRRRAGHAIQALEFASRQRVLRAVFVCAHHCL
jgi:glutamate synthase (NADPH/NADH) large chain